MFINNTEKVIQQYKLMLVWWDCVWSGIVTLLGYAATLRYENLSFQ